MELIIPSITKGALTGVSLIKDPLMIDGLAKLYNI
jgi:hypothetical protein